MFFYIPTSKGYPVLFLADTTLYNQYSSVSRETFLQTLTDFSNFEEALDGLRTIMGRYGITNLPTLTMGTVLPASQSPALADNINRVMARFPISVISPNTTISNNYLGVSYGPVTVKLSGTALQADCFITASQISNSNCYLYMRHYVTGATPYSFRFTVHLIPETAITENGTLNSANLGTYDNPLTFQAWYNYISEKYEAFVSIGNTRRTPTTASKNLLNNIAINIPEPPISSEDPYTGAGYPESTAPGGISGGSFDFTDNGLTAIHTPDIDLLSSGFLTAWNVNKAQLNALANWLWVTTPSQIFQQIYGNPINAVIGLNVVPVAPSIDGGSNTIKFGPEDSQVAAPKITSQYVSVDCGTLTIAPVYGSYMDYGPYSSAELFLPYCGGVPLDINDVVGKTISVKYQVDILSGACVAYIFIDGHLHYQKSGCCAGTAPVTGSQMPNVISGVLSIVGSVAGAVASLGASGASTAAKVASGIATGTNVADAATNALKRSISYSGTVSGWAGLLGAQKPYLILTLPNAAIPAGQQQLSGYPAWVGGRLSDFSGHTECTSVHLNGLRATDEEMQEIRALLESGVIL